MIIKFFDKLHYKLSLSEEHINDIIRSRSKCGPSIRGNEFSYDVNFTDKGFKMKFVQSVNFGGIYSLSPIFSGKIEEDCGFNNQNVSKSNNGCWFSNLFVLLLDRYSFYFGCRNFGISNYNCSYSDFIPLRNHKNHKYSI